MDQEKEIKEMGKFACISCRRLLRDEDGAIVGCTAGTTPEKCGICATFGQTLYDEGYRKLEEPKDTSKPSSIPVVGFELTFESLVNLWSSAVYGIAYWCDVIDYSKYRDEGLERCRQEGIKTPCMEEIIAGILLTGGTIALYDAEDETEVYLACLDDIKHGIELAIENEYWDGEDWGDVDADVADAIIQFAVFDDITFG